MRGCSSGAPGGILQLHPIMDDAQNLHNAIGRHAVDQQVAGIGHAIVHWYMLAGRPEVESPHAGNSIDGARTLSGGRVAHCGGGGED
jgi:hypothetical protein